MSAPPPVFPCVLALVFAPSLCCRSYTALRFELPPARHNPKQVFKGGVARNARIHAPTAIPIPRPPGSRKPVKTKKHIWGVLSRNQGYQPLQGCYPWLPIIARLRRARFASDSAVGTSPRYAIRTSQNTCINADMVCDDWRWYPVQGYQMFDHKHAVHTVGVR